MLKLPRVEFGLADFAGTLERLAGSVEGEAAGRAEGIHARGKRAAFWTLVALAGTMWVLSQPFAAARPEVLRGVFAALLVGVPLAAFLLGVFGRVAWAGRALVPCLLLPLMLEPPSGGVGEYFAGFAAATAAQLAAAFLAGWAMDAGTGGFFAPKAWEAVLRVPLSFAVPAAWTWLPGWPAAADGRVAGWLAGWLGAGVIAAFAARGAGWLTSDASRLARFASTREGRRYTARAFATLFLLSPAFLALAALEGGIRFRPPEASERPLTMRMDAAHRHVLEFWGVPFRASGEDAEEFSVYAPEMGRVLTEADLGCGDLYDVPFTDLIDPSRKGREWAPGSVHYVLHDRLSGLVGLAQTRTAAEAAWFTSIAKNAHGLAEMEDRLPADLRLRGRRIVLWVDENVKLSRLAERICDDMATIRGAPDDSEEALEDLQAALGPYRVTARNAHETRARLQNGFHSVLFRCEKRTGRAYFSMADGSGRPQAKTVCSAGILDMRPMDRETLRRLGGRQTAIAIPTLLCVVIAGLLLWSRGGASPVALCLGVAVAAVSILAFSEDQGVTVEFHRSLWKLAAEGPLGSLLGALAGVTTVSAKSIAEGVGMLAVAAAFVLLCLPAGGAGTPIRRLLRFAGLTLLTTVAASAVQWGLVYGMLGVGRAADLFWAEAVLRVGAFTVMGWALRRKRRRHSEAPWLGWRFPAAWLCLLLPSRLAAMSLANDGDNQLLAPLWEGAAWATPLFLWGAVLSAVAFTLFLELCLRHDFLGLLNANRLTVWVFALAVPALAEVANGFTGDLLSDTGLFSGVGNRVVGVLFTVVVMNAFWKKAEGWLRRLFVRGLGKVETRVGRMLEESVASTSREGGFFRNLREVLRSVGVPRWAFYERMGCDGLTLRPTVSEGMPRALGMHSSIGVSEFFAARLGGYHRVVARRTLATSDELFFVSFELARAMRAIGAESVLPVSLGHSLRGLLAVPGDSGGRWTQDDVAAEINHIGVELAREHLYGGR